MAKFRRYRKYSRRGRAKYAANLQEIGTTSIVFPQGAEDGPWSRSFTLAFNPTQINTAVSQVFTVKNFEVTFEVSTNALTGTVGQYVEDIVAYIMFVPQGMTVTENYNLQHPEYVMAYKFLGSPVADNPTSLAQPARVRTRLSRKLQSGDSVILFLKGNLVGSPTSQINLEFHGLARWWTKAN